MSLLQTVLQCFYFIIPAYFANMAPVIVKKIPFLVVPIDANKTLGGQPLFGRNKTYRGFVFGVLFAIIITFFQNILSSNGIFIGLEIVDYENWFSLGVLMGFGAIIGDLMESFVKRRLKYDSGKPFVPFDQTDFIIGALIFVAPIVILPFGKILTLLIMSFVLHVTVNHVAFFLKIRNEKW